MFVLSAPQIKQWDAYTIQHEPINSVDLMERAATLCVDWQLQQPISEKQIFIFCGKGNNGGDGLAIARMLSDKGVSVSVYILEFGKLGSPDFQINLQRLHTLPVPLHFIESEAQFPQLPPGAVVIDALYGIGLTGPLSGLSSKLVKYINAAQLYTVSIDLPSGLLADSSSAGFTIIKATHTLTFACYKLGLLMAENAPFIGQVHLLPLKLDPNFLKSPYPFRMVQHDVKKLFKPRNRFGHKGTYGHALIIGGSYGKIGATVLATKACLKSGSGLVTSYLPKCGYVIMQTTASEAMTITDSDENFITTLPPDLDKYNAIGIGPGMGTAEETIEAIKKFLSIPVQAAVFDADALNCLALQPELLNQLFQNSILTPHPKEFDRLFGPSNNDFERMNKAIENAKRLGVVIVLKGHHTLIACPDGNNYFNTTGNAGMAKGGSGDVLTGILTALLACGYNRCAAAITGVYLHGLAGDFAAKALSMESMTATDLITFLAPAFLAINNSVAQE